MIIGDHYTCDYCSKEIFKTKDDYVSLYGEIHIKNNPNDDPITSPIANDFHWTCWLKMKGLE